MKEKLNPGKIPDYTEKTWFLGNNLLDDKDLELMDDKLGTSLWREEGAMYYVNAVTTDPDFYKNLGYSPYFQEIINEAQKRGYVWVFFDRDIES